MQGGKPVLVVSEPGLYWRIPFVQTVVQFDRRILDLETEEQEVIAADQKRLVVDAFARYKILDPLRSTARSAPRRARARALPQSWTPRSERCSAGLPSST